MIHLAVPLAVGSGLVGAGLYGMLARRHPMMLLLGAQVTVAGAALILVTTSSTGVDPSRSGEVLAVLLWMVVTAATLLVAGASLLAHRLRGRTDLTEAGPDGTPLAGAVDDATEPEPVLDDETPEVTA